VAVPSAVTEPSPMAKGDDETRDERFADDGDDDSPRADA
jgi:hypothetical protein